LPNKGYGHSLNEGIEYARKNYEFKYLAITNADILVKKFDLNIEDKACVFAPEVITKTGKKQNPFYIFQYRKSFLFARWAKDHFLKIFKYSVMVKAKIHRVLFNLFYVKGTYRKIYAAHGCFIVFNEKALELLGRPFEDDIFLYCEENFLGHKLKRMGIPLYYTSRVSVRHMEDGSSAFYKHKINACVVCVITSVVYLHYSYLLVIRSNDSYLGNFDFLIDRQILTIGFYGFVPPKTKNAYGESPHAYNTPLCNP
jgi:GT2 family glycosyltransferase